MPNAKTTALPAVTAATADMSIPVVQAGVNKRSTPPQVVTSGLGVTLADNGGKVVAVKSDASGYELVMPATGGGAAGKVDATATRTTMKSVNTTSTPIVFLQESGREGLFEWDPAVTVARHQADTQEGVFVAPNAGAAGAWVRIFTGPVDVRWFGYVADDTTDVRTAILGALAYLKAVSPDVGTGAIQFPVGKAYCSAMISLDQRVTLQGQGSGQQTTQPSWIRFPAGTSGFVIQLANTIGETGTDGSSDGGAGGTIIRGLKITGGYPFGATNVSEGEFHGIRMRARAIIEDCLIGDFQGDGIRIDANTGNGNANGWNVRRCTLGGNRDGLYVGGGEVNAGRGELLDVTLNRRWGINDLSFLGNTYEGCHAAHNGVTGPPYRGVVLNGRSYIAIRGQEAGASTNAPSGTDQSNQWWYHFVPYAYASWPTWTSGMNVLEAGGQYASAFGNPRNVFIGCYSEMGGTPSFIQSPSQVIGGLHGAGILGGAAVLDSFEGMFMLTAPLRVKGRSSLNAAHNEEELFFGNGAANGDIIAGNLKSLTGRFYLQGWNGNVLWSLNNGNPVSVLYTGENTTFTFDRGGIIKHATIHNKLMVMDVASADFNTGRLLGYATEAPTNAANFYAAGDFLFNKAGNNRLLGWQCTFPGAGGVASWQPLYGLKAGEQAAITNASSPDATDLASAQTLVNELKAKLNTALAALRATGVIAA